MIPLKSEFGSCCERPEVGLRIGGKVFKLSEQRHWAEVEHMKKKKGQKSDKNSQQSFNKWGGGDPLSLFLSF